MSETPIKVVVVTDGVVGHENQSIGLCKWLERRWNLDVSVANVQLREKALSRLLLPKLLPEDSRAARRILKLFYETPELPDEADLVISTGGNSSFANILVASMLGCPNIYLGSLRRLNPRRINVHMTLEPTGYKNNLVMTMSPNLVDPKAVLDAGSSLLKRRKLDGTLWTLIIGGTGAGFDYGEQEWRLLATWANSMAEKYGIRWLLTTSRRTGGKGESVLKEHLKPEHIAYAVWWDSEPKKELLALIGAGTQVFTTADSMSMMTESIASSRPTTVVALPTHRANERYRAAMDRFARLGLCRLIQLSDETYCPPIPAMSFDLSTVIDQTLDQLEYRLAC
ncbi:ELM1/GtrOC1 family putative glycosyltransferase [Congregibacter litoralis]|uniref:Putative nucleoside-diphosphate-sugar epimerase n=1 Tax=Congregibacter litoralis KT71 TaxID=314285 RepID=A4AAF6_9GAMM|nr:ELM1/GtrOC1 family putative glycosyltransferase [Congregibacter litoralis]EAQ97033.1 putative nucleoside-diphosphate-sugar epimerase [Congregibacter litoralis KT71]